jgi:hypothetical protein
MYVVVYVVHALSGHSRHRCAAQPCGFRSTKGLERRIRDSNPCSWRMRLLSGFVRSSGVLTVLAAREKNEPLLPASTAGPVPARRRRIPLPALRRHREFAAHRRRRKPAFPASIPPFRPTTTPWHGKGERPSLERSTRRARQLPGGWREASSVVVGPFIWEPGLTRIPVRSAPKGVVSQSEERHPMLASVDTWAFEQPILFG